MKREIRMVLNIITLLIIVGGYVPTAIVSASPIALTQSSVTSGVKQCYSLDVVFIVDQSESMSINPGATDPMVQRKYAIDSAIDQLADNALDACPGSIHRIGIISFGTQPEVDLPMGLINPETVNESIAISTKLKSYVKAVDLGYTDPILAFKTANDLFSTDFTSSTVSGKAGLRKRVIIFITDGVPQREKAADPIGLMRELGSYITTAFPFNPTIIQQDSCLNTLRDRYDANLETAPQSDVNDCISKSPITQPELDSSTYIFGLFFPSNAAYQSIVDEWQKIVDSHEGKLYFLSNNRQEVSSTIRDIISTLIGVKLNVVKCGSFAVNPYLKRAIFTFFKIDPSLKVTLSYQDTQGVTHTINSGQAGSTGGFEIGDNGYSVDGSNERYVINQPYPGIWQLTADNCSGLDVYYDPVIIQPDSYQPNLPVIIPQYEISPYFDKYKPYYLEYQIQDVEGVVLTQADDPTLAININLNVQDPNGQPKSYAMVWDPVKKLFRTTNPLQLPLAGKYTINMVGTYLSHPGDVSVQTTNMSEVFTQETTLFEQKGIQFSVHPVIPFTIALAEPKQGQIIGTVHETILDGWPLKIKPIKVTVKLTDQNNKPLDAGKILDDPATPFDAVITAGQKTSETTNLNLDPANIGVYTGEIPNFASTGEQVVKATLTSNFNEYYRPQDQVVQATVTRRDNLFTTPETYYVILGLLLIYLAARIILWNYGRRHALEGYLLAKESGTVLRVLKLSNGTNRINFDEKFWNRDPNRTLGIRRLTVTSGPQSKNPEDLSGTTPDGNPPSQDGSFSTSKKSAISCYCRTQAKSDVGILNNSDEMSIGDSEERRSLQYIATIADGLAYVQDAEDSGQKIKLIPALLFVGSLICALLLAFVMIF